MHPLARLINRRNGYFAFCFLLLYLLGVGIARYLGSRIIWSSFLLGLLWIGISVSGIMVLQAYFTRQSAILKSTKIDSPEEKRKNLRIQNILFVVVTSIFTIVAVITVLMIYQGILYFTLGLVIITGFFLALFLVTPPFRLWRSGLGEFIFSFLACQIIPAIGFLFQNQDLNRMVSMSTLPLTAFFFAMQIAFQFESFGVDSGNQTGTLLTRIGWQNGVRTHHILIILGYLVLGAAFWMGLSWRIIWPVLLTAIIASLQVYLLNRIASGEKPAWRLYRITASALFLVSAYLLTYSFWTL